MNNGVIANRSNAEDAKVLNKAANLLVSLNISSREEEDMYMEKRIKDMQHMDSHGGGDGNLSSQDILNRLGRR
jgi:hypothetical protein